MAFGEESQAITDREIAKGSYKGLHRLLDRIAIALEHTQADADAEFTRELIQFRKAGAEVWVYLKEQLFKGDVVGVDLGVVRLRRGAESIMIRVSAIQSISAVC